MDPSPINYSDEEKSCIVASMIGPLFSKIKLVLRNPLKNINLAMNE